MVLQSDLQYAQGFDKNGAQEAKRERESMKLQFDKLVMNNVGTDVNRSGWDFVKKNPLGRSLVGIKGGK